ncbi:MAG: DUF3343 domain-containing protein [Clostridia bacterium]|nr:DUF3343 domain-containing protein [Clostridia bacterium]
MKYYNYGGCQAELQSMTAAQRAQRILASAAIPSDIIKVGSSSRRGCSYGIEFACNQRNNVEATLLSAGIAVKRWNRTD